MNHGNLEDDEYVNLTPAGVRRRIDFLIAEARSDKPQYDHAVRFVLRAVSNFYSVGFDAGSSKLKQHIRWMSEAALNRKKEIEKEFSSKTEQAKRFSKETVNEHSYELRQLWQTIVDCKGDLTHEEVAGLFKKYPMITILKSEDDDLKPHKGLSASERYRRAKIVVMNHADGEWRPATIDVN